MIKEIFIGDEEFKEYRFYGNGSNAIQQLSRVNIFIGPNNSGKSRLMRRMFVIEHIRYKEEGKLFVDLERNILALKDNWDNAPMQMKNAYAERNPQFEDLVKLVLSKIYSSNKANPAKDGTYAAIKDIQSVVKTIDLKGGFSFREYNILNKDIINNLSAITFTLHKINYNKYNKHYIPMLRGLRPVDVGSKIKEDVFTNIDLYKIRTQKDYFKQLNDDEQKQISDTIFTGLEIYEDVRKHLLGTREQRNKIQEFEQFLQETFFPDKEVSLVPKEGEDVLLIGLNDEERLIYDLGDGIQSIIQMLYPIFMRQGTNALFFIEEPELSLHPGMQRVFLETLLSERFSSMQFFITTHSNHFLDLTMDNDNISVYGFSKKDKDKFIIKLLEGPNKHVLKDIGVRNSSVFLANCSIWVEGVTDRKYLRKFLELYVKSKKQDSKYLEDMHYVFVEYGGSNIVHWSFDEKGNESGSINANKLNNSIFLIADSDIGKDGIQPDDKRNRHETLKQALGENFYITEGKEVENMLSPKAILHIVKHYEKSSESFKGDINRKTNQKSFNTQQKIKKPDYWNYNLGECIDVNLPNRERNTYKDGNTVLDKYRFCELAIESMDSFEDLSDEAKLLSEKIFNFIVDNNK